MLGNDLKSNSKTLLLRLLCSPQQVGRYKILKLLVFIEQRGLWLCSSNETITVTADVPSDKMK